MTHLTTVIYNCSVPAIQVSYGQVGKEKRVSRKKAQPFKIRNILPYAYHEAGHAVVGHVIGRLIERVSIASSSENGYRGYCRFSPYMESANGHLDWQDDSANPDIVTIYFAGQVAMEMVCQRHGWDYEKWQECDRADREAIERWCRESLDTTEQYARVREECLTQAQSILARSVDAVDALAVELVLHEQVAGGEAHRLIREALGENGDDWRLITWGIADEES